MSQELLGIARMGYLLTSEGATDERVREALEIIGSVVDAGMIGLVPMPGLETDVDLGQIWSAGAEVPDGWIEKLASLEFVWTEIAAHGSTQLSLEIDALGPGVRPFREAGFAFAGFFPVMVGGEDIGALAVFTERHEPWESDQFIYLRICAGALANHFAVRAHEAQTSSVQAAYQSLVDEIDGAFVRTGPSGSIRLVSQQAPTVLGIPTGDLIGTPIFDIFDAAHRPMLEEKFQAVLEGDSDKFRLFSHLATPDGLVDVEIIAKAATIGSSGVREVVCAIFDATPQLRSANLLAQELKRESLGVMAGAIAHDFNNLLQSMLTSADILGERIPEDDPDHEFIELIRNSGRRMGEQTAQLRAFARGGNPRPQRISIVDILKQVLDSRRFQGESRVRVSVTLSASLKQVEADPNQIFQVLYNVTVNAFEAIEASRGNLNIIGRNVELGDDRPVAGSNDAAEGEYVELTFADTGKGISEADIKRIFDPFFTTKTLGAGMGLAAAHGIVRAHGGMFDVESVVREGTTVRIYLPAVSDPD